MTRPRIIALEEHFVMSELRDANGATMRVRDAHTWERLEDFSGGRIAEMDAAGIDARRVPGV